MEGMNEVTQHTFFTFHEFDLIFTPICVEYEHVIFGPINIDQRFMDGA
jgi:hypothetical protein